MDNQVRDGKAVWSVQENNKVESGATPKLKQIKEGLWTAVSTVLGDVIWGIFLIKEGRKL